MAQAPRTVDITADTLRQRILDGTYATGDRLPAERKLSSELGISRLTLRAALARLQSEGLVQPRQGDGVRVLAIEAHAGVELLPHLLDASRGLSLLGPFLQLRRALAAEALAEATRRATQDDLAGLEDLARSLQEADGDALIDGNLRFSAHIIGLADNLPMRLLFNTVARVYRSRPEIQTAMLADPAGVRASFLAIVALMRAGDADAARETVRVVLEALDQATLATLVPPSEAEAP
jgi:DNA-binding FadR family transcriptional regulator